MSNKNTAETLSTGTQVRRGGKDAISDSSGNLMTRLNRKKLNYNPLEIMAKGDTPPRVVMEHKKKALAGNLFFEYIQNVPQFRGYGINGEAVAEFLAKAGLIIYDAEVGNYEWIGEPLTKRDFLRLFPAKGEFSQEGDNT